MTTGRLVKSHEDITMTEVTFSGVNGVLGKAYSVRAANDPASTEGDARQTSQARRSMSAFGGKADITSTDLDVRY